MAVLRIHAFLPRSRANGPGLRAVVWVQGCTLQCEGCFNPETHPRKGGRWVDPKKLAAQIVGDREVEGITISGGEPLQQPRALLDLLEEVRARSTLSVLLFSGYTLEEIQRRRLGPAVLGCVDVLVAGRYDCRQPLGSGLRGSANQEIHFLTGRYTLADVEAIPPLEVVIGSDGALVATGVGLFSGFDEGRE